MKMVPEMVDAIPWDVDGDRRFQIFYEEDKYMINIEMADGIK